MTFALASLPVAHPPFPFLSLPSALPLAEIGGQIALFDHFLLLAAVFCAVTLVKLLRGERVGRIYAVVVGVQLVAAVLAMGASRFFGVLVLGLVTVSVAIPWVLEQASRWAFGRGQLAWMARLSSLRVILMPGSGLEPQLPILEGLALLEREGVDAALVHYRRMAGEAEEGRDAAMIHEQIISMLFHDERWDEGIAHYERRFKPGYAALRPSLALGLLRAYGESGRLEMAAGLLRALEDGPVGDDPKAVEILGQAQLTFLAYAGATGAIAALSKERGYPSGLGISEATAALFEGIAQFQAGDPQGAVAILSRVESLAGPRDRRVREAADAALTRARASAASVPAAEGASAPVPTPALAPAELGDAPTSPDQRHGLELWAYVELVAERLQTSVWLTPERRRRATPWATYGLVVGLSMVYGMHVLLGGGGVGLLELGALSEDLWRSGASSRIWARTFTSVWLHVDLVGLLFDVYAIWLAGQIVERVLGPARLLVVTVGAAIVGMAASVLAQPLLRTLGMDAIATVGATGGSLMAVGALVAGLWLLLPGKTPQIETRARRNLSITLGLLLLADLLLGSPSVFGAGVAPVGLGATMAVASLVVLAVPIDQPRWLRAGFGGLVAAMFVASGLGFVLTLPEDPEQALIDHRVRTCTKAGIELRAPLALRKLRTDLELGFALPVVPNGLVDTLEIRAGGLVQISVFEGLAPTGEPALLSALGTEAGGLSATAVEVLPEPFAGIVAGDLGEGRWQAFDLWRDGERIGRVVERRMPIGADSSATLTVSAAPAEALDHAAGLYAAILSEAIWVGAGKGFGLHCRVAG